MRRCSTVEHRAHEASPAEQHRFDGTVDSGLLVAAAYGRAFAAGMARRYSSALRQPALDEPSEAPAGAPNSERTAPRQARPLPAQPGVHAADRAQVRIEVALIEARVSEHALSFGCW